MPNVFNPVQEICPLQGNPISITNSDEITYVATPNVIFSTEPTECTKLRRLLTSSVRIKKLQALPDIGILTIVFDDHVELRNISNLSNLNDRCFQSLNLRVEDIVTYSSSNASQAPSRSSSSDILSLATVVIDKPIASDRDNPANPDAFITLLALLSKNQITILKWNNREYVDRYNLYVSNIKFLKFTSTEDLICMSSTKPNILIHINLQTSKISHHDLTRFLHLSEKDYDNAILLIENLDIHYFLSTDDESKRENVNLNQFKFIKLRKFNLLKAVDLMNDGSENDFALSIDLFSEFLAPPKLVVENIPKPIKLILNNERSNSNNDAKDLSASDRFCINQLIKYLTDSKRKLLRFKDSKDTVFQFGNMEISLSIYQDNDPGFSVEENLILIDDYLFKCYLLVNVKMIGPFLRLNNYCDFDMVEEKCKALCLSEQLVAFYSSNTFIKRARKYDDLLAFLQRMVQNDDPPIDLIFENLKTLISALKNNDDTDPFYLVFLNESFDYSNVHYDDIIRHLQQEKWKQYLLDYLEFIFTHENKTNLQVTTQLLNIYFEDIDGNSAKIQKLFEKGHYNANQALARLKTHSQSEHAKRLMVSPLQKLGRYDDILSIYVHELKDTKEAVNFALNMRDIKNDSLSRGLIFKIIDMCLLEKDHSSIVQFVLNNANLDFINFEEILIKLPNDMSMNLMSSLLLMNLKNMNTINHRLVVKNELLRANLTHLKLDKMNLERKMVRLTSSSVCSKCGRYFNKSEILCFHPNGNILHYKCSKVTY
ncbi:hypothetical protein CAS74_001607 [Pichia kudriavzevii]|uniref:Vacuolar morphogenesis protein 6 n=1 Tax=Pichia kudriavzevii TaxID=4909 RepID=A0A1Z8JRS8_PICKU|nr:hypothetical protein CAS74_001607 [Pichia kudriavzevii]